MKTPSDSPTKELSVVRKGTVLCIGGGPAGLTAAYLLAQRGWRVAVLEANQRHLGDISSTVVYNGFRCDIGGHRFFSRSAETALAQPGDGREAVLRYDDRHAS